MTLSVCESHNIAIAGKAALFTSHEGLGTPLGNLPDAPKPKEGRIRRLFCIGLRMIHGLALWEFPATCTQCSPLLKTLVDQALAREC